MVSNMLGALDLGSSRVLALIGEVLPGGRVQVRGVGRAPSQGIRYGTLVEMAPAIEAVKSAVAGAEDMAGCEFPPAVVSLGGAHINSLNSHGGVALNPEQSAQEAEVDEDALLGVLASSRAVELSPDQCLLHVIPTRFQVDHQPVCRNPLRLRGMKLSADTHLILGSVMARANHESCLQRAGVRVLDLVWSGLASASSCLQQVELEEGVLHLDLGGGTCSATVYRRGKLEHSWVHPMGGEALVQELATVLQTARISAERLLAENAVADPELLAGSDPLVVVKDVRGRGQHRIPVSQIAGVTNAWLLELFRQVREDARSLELLNGKLRALVLSGGLAGIHGIEQLAESMFGLPARKGLPRAIDGPMGILGGGSSTCAAGLLLMAAARQGELNFEAFPAVGEFDHLGLKSRREGRTWWDGVGKLLRRKR